MHKRGSKQAVKGLEKAAGHPLSTPEACVHPGLLLERGKLTARGWSRSGDVVDQKASIAELEAEKAEITVSWGQRMGGDHVKVSLRLWFLGSKSLPMRLAPFSKESVWGGMGGEMENYRLTFPRAQFLISLKGVVGINMSASV